MGQPETTVCRPTSFNSLGRNLGLIRDLVKKLMITNEVCRKKEDDSEVDPHYREDADDD